MRMRVAILQIMSDICRRVGIAHFPDYKLKRHHENRPCHVTYIMLKSSLMIELIYQKEYDVIR